MIGIVISDTFLVIGVWSEENNDLALHNVKQIEYTEPINDIIHKERDLNSVLGIAIRRASEAIPFSGQDISVAISDEFIYDISDEYNDFINVKCAADKDVELEEIRGNLKSEIERYRNLIDVAIENKDYNIASDEIISFLESSEPFSYLYGEFDYYLSLIDYVGVLYRSNDYENSKMIVYEIKEQFEKRLSTFSTLPEESQLYYIENISSDINNYQKAINQIKRFDNNLSDSLQSEFDKLIDRMVE